MDCLGVVPIFISAGAAVMPTILAAGASVAGVLLKPKELLALCRRRPIAVAAAGSAVCVCVILVSLALRPAKPIRATQAAQQTKPHYDWAKVAENLLAMEAAGNAPTLLYQVADAGAAAPTVSDPPKAIPAIQSAESVSPRGLKTLWRYRPEDTMFLSQPLVAGKHVFAAGCQADLGGYTGLLACLDVDTGKPVWEISNLGNAALLPFFSSPALTKDGKYLIIGQGLHQDRDCSLLCFEADTGKLHWAVKTPLHIESSPAIFGDMAVVGVGAIEGHDGRAVGDPGFVMMVRISDGKQIWKQTVIDPESNPAVDEAGMVYIGSGFNGNAIVALRSDTTEQLQQNNSNRIAWQTAVGLPVTSAMTLVDDMLISGAGNGNVVTSNENAAGAVVALDRKTGQTKWKTSFGDGVLGAVAARDGVLIAPIRTGEVAALSAKDGHVLWKTPISGKSPVIAGCGFTKDCVYAVSSDGFLAILDAKDGKLLEKTYLNDQAKPGTGLTMSSPQIVGDRVFVGSETGGMHCLVGSAGTPQ